MDETHFRTALHSAVLDSAAPPPMRAADAIKAGRKAQRRRLALTALAGVAVLGLVSGVTVVAAGRLGAPDRSTRFAGPGGTPSVAPGPKGSGRAFPTDQAGHPMQDRTARAGQPEYETGKLLLERLLTAVPPGYTAPDLPQTSDRPPSRDHQAQFEDWVGDKAIWSYSADVQVSQGGKTGRLLVEVHQPGLLPDANGCLAHLFWGLNGGPCADVDVNGTKVSVAGADPNDGRIDQVAAYRFADGVTVFVAQAKAPDFADDHDGEALPAPPLSTDQLAALAIDERFHVVRS